jgi:hypothetical protein
MYAKKKKTPFQNKKAFFLIYLITTRNKKNIYTKNEKMRKEKGCVVVLLASIDMEGSTAHACAFISHAAVFPQGK